MYGATQSYELHARNDDEDALTANSAVRIHQANTTRLTDLSMQQLPSTILITTIPLNIIIS